MTYILFAWIASFMFGLEAIIGKLTSKYSISNPWMFNFVYSLAILIFTVPIALANHASLPVDWTVLSVATFYYTVTTIFYILAIYLLDISILAPLFNFRTVFSVLLGGLMLGQILTTPQYVLIAIIFISGYFVSLDEHYNLKSFISWPIAVAMAEMITLALMGVYINKSIAVNGYWSTTLWMPVLSQILLLFTLPLFKREVNKISGKQIGYLAVMALVSMGGILASNVAYTGNVGISSAIIGLPFSMVMAFLFAIFAPKLLEKHTNKVYAIRFAAAGVMLLAALRLSG